MPVDHSIYSQMQTPDFLGAVQKGMSMKQMATEGKMKQESFNRDKQRHDIDMMARLAGSVTDQASYDAAIAEGQKLQLSGVEQLPKLYDPNLVKGILGKSLSAKEQLDNQFREKELLQRSEDRKSENWYRNEMLKATRGEKKDAKIDSNVQKLSKEVEGTQSLMSSLDDVEAQLGGRIEDFKEGARGILTKDGKAVDLPGVSIPFIGRVSAHSSAARRLKDSAAGVFNAQLKDRSGGSVTDSELSRLKTEFSEGKFNTEPELIAALQRYKARTAEVLKNREAAFDPEVVARYTEQGGRTSQTLPKQIASKDHSGGGMFTPQEANASQMKPLKTNQIDWAD